jgi:ribosomal protein S18 acetylase RimI-like enzyme
MIKILEYPEYLTVEQAEKKYRPNSVVMINCTVEDYAPVAGYVVAAETNGGEDFEELDKYEMELKKDPSNEEIFFIMTDDPYAGQGLFISQDF